MTGRPRRAERQGLRNTCVVPFLRMVGGQCVLVGKLKLPIVHARSRRELSARSVV